MKKDLLFFLLLFMEILLPAQPVIDKTRPGIKSLKIMVCGYDHGKDSTGLVLFREYDYNTKGETTSDTRISENGTYLNDGDTELEWPPVSYFYLYHNRSSERKYDTTTYQYSAGFLKTVTKSDKYNKVSIVYAYDANGKCISEISSRGGVEESRREWKYNAHGDVLSETIIKPGKPAAKACEMKYDAKNRLIMRVRYNHYNDSTIYSYSANGKEEKVYYEGDLYERKHYDNRDSLISLARFLNGGKSKEKTTEKLIDSTYISRNAQGTRTSVYMLMQYDSDVMIETTRCDEKGRYVETITNQNGENIRRQTYTYDDAKHTSTYRRYGIYHNKSKTDQYGEEYIVEERIIVYNDHKEIVEIAITDGKGKLVDRAVYQYTYY